MILVMVDIIMLISGIASLFGLIFLVLYKINERNKNKIHQMFKNTTNTEEINRIIEEELGIAELSEKINFLETYFDIDMCGLVPETQDDYKLMLNLVIEQNKRMEKG